MKSLLHDEGIDALPQAPGWVEVAHRPSRMRELAAHAARYRALLGRAEAVEVLDRAALDARGLMRGPAAHGALRFDDAFGLHPLRYARGLAAAAVRRGAALHDGSRVVGWTRERNWHFLATDGAPCGPAAS